MGSKRDLHAMDRISPALRRKNPQRASPNVPGRAKAHLRSTLVNDDWEHTFIVQQWLTIAPESSPRLACRNFDP
jgi:hypothetical protein